MCTLVLYFQVFPDWPIVVGANRDESLARPSSAPDCLWSTPWIVGGQDLLAGGTWFGINEHGVVVGILNRHSPVPPNPRCRSRGLLCLDALKHASAAAARHFVLTQNADHYNPFSLVVADRLSAYVLFPHNHTVQAQRLAPGVHMLTNRDPNDRACPRIARSLDHFLHLGPQASTPGPLLLSTIFTQLRQLLAGHAATADAREGLCLHLDGYGTCSSTLLAYAPQQGRYTYHFSPGSPCRTAYNTVSVPPAALTSQPPSTT